MGSEALEAFHPAVREWFRTAFASPTPAQAQAWPVIKHGDSTLLMAPTGSGKTLAAFLSAIDALIQAPGRGCRVVYVSPLKALAVDVERNLRSPIPGIGHDAERLGPSASGTRRRNGRWMRWRDSSAASAPTARVRSPSLTLATASRFS